jgi:hypothetical protein
MEPRKSDELQMDVLTCLFLSGIMRLQWSELRDNLLKKYSKCDKESFEVLLSRALARLLKSGYLKKDDKGHQEVFYYIPKKRQQKVIDQISKRFLYTKVDEFWEKFSLDQKKRLAKDLVYSQSMRIGVEKRFFKEMFSIFGGGANDLIERDKLDNSLLENTSAHSPEERAERNNQLVKIRNDCAKMEANFTTEDKFVADNLNELMELSLEFQNLIVDPIYNGNGPKALAGIMRKAIMEEKQKVPS